MRAVEVTRFGGPEVLRLADLERPSPISTDFTAWMPISVAASRAQLEAVLSQLGAMLRAHPRLESASAWIRLPNLPSGSFDLEMQAYVLTRDYDDYTAVREEILLRLMHIVERCGSVLASSSPTIYLAPKPEAQPQAAAAKALGSGQG